MADEPSNSELWRLIEAMDRNIRDDLGQINARMDRLVHVDVYQAEKAAIVKEINDLKGDLTGVHTRLDRDAERVTATRRWMIASVLIPLLGLVLPYLVVIQGAGS